MDFLSNSNPVAVRLIHVFGIQSNETIKNKILWGRLCYFCLLTSLFIVYLNVVIYLFVKPQMCLWLLTHILNNFWMVWQTDILCKYSASSMVVCVENWASPNPHRSPFSSNYTSFTKVMLHQSFYRFATLIKSYLKRVNVSACCPYRWFIQIFIYNCYITVTFIHVPVTFEILLGM